MSNIEEFYFFTGSVAFIILCLILLSISYEMAKHPIVASWMRLTAILALVWYAVWVWLNL